MKKISIKSIKAFLRKGKGFFLCLFKHFRLILLGIVWRTDLILAIEIS
jgi:hypothetical protein